MPNNEIQTMQVECLKNAAGILVPIMNIDKLDIACHNMVEKYIKRAEKLNRQLAKLKLDVIKDVIKLQEKAERKGKRIGGQKGYATIKNYSKSEKVCIDVQEFLSENDNFDAAYEKLQECILKWSQGSNAHLIQLVNHAFKKKKGKLSIPRVMGLLVLKVDDPDWLEAMELLKASFDYVTSGRYPRFFKKDANDDWQPIAMNLSSVRIDWTELEPKAKKKKKG